MPIKYTDRHGLPVTMDVSEASAATGLAEKTIRNHLSAGKIHALRVGRRVRIPLAEIRRIMGLDPDETGGTDVA